MEVLLEGWTPLPVRSETINSINIICKLWIQGFPGGSDSKESAFNVGDLGLIPGLGRSPGEGNGNSLQYSCPENSMDRGAWWATVQGVQRVRHNWVTNTFTVYQVIYTTSFHLIFKKEKKDIEAAFGSQGRFCKEMASQPSQDFQKEWTWIPVQLE